METIQELRKNYLLGQRAKQGELLRFQGVDNRDVYNCSVPFEYDGKTYILGRVEKRNEWANSMTLLFEKKEDIWQRALNFEPLPIEDPFITEINGEFVVGGTHVLKERGEVKTYYAYFYRGKDIFNLRYFTTGPEYMKDIRLVQLPRKKIGIFSRPRNDEIKQIFGYESQIGFCTIDSLDELDSKIIDSAKYIDGIFCKGEWGGVCQAFYLGNNLIGMIGHQCYTEYIEGSEKAVYLNTAYVIELSTGKLLSKKVIGQRSDYPQGESKIPGLSDCTFTSGMVYINKYEAELYSGLGDVSEGKIIIENPFDLQDRFMAL